MVTFRPSDKALVLPAVSREREGKLNVPLGNGRLVIVRAPWALDVAVPNTVLFTIRSMVVFAGPVPVNVGVLSVVLLSVLDAPVSEAAVRSGTPGTGGGVVSIVTDSAADCWLVVFPLTE